MKYFKIVFIFFILIFLSFKYSANKKYPCTVLTNLKFYDSDSAAYVSDKLLILKNGLITDITDNLSPDLKNTCDIIDLKSSFVFPGFIDAHTHLLAIDKQRVSGWKQALEISAFRPDMMRIFIGEKNAKSMLYSGFTTVRDLGNSGDFLDKQLKSRIEKKISLGPDIIFSGPAIAINPSQIDLKFNSKEYTTISGISDIYGVLEKYKSQHTMWLKVYADNSTNQNLMPPDLLNAFVEKAQSMGFKVSIHAEFAQSIAVAMQAKPDSIEHFYEIPAPFAVTGPPPYIVITDYSLQVCKNLKFAGDCSKKIESFKVRYNWLKFNAYKVVFGSDGVLDFTSDFNSRGELSLASLLSLVQIGLSNKEIIAAATSTPADMLSLPIGRIAIGKKADLISFPQDPLIDINNIKTKNLIITRGEVLCKNLQGCKP